MNTSQNSIAGNLARVQEHIATAARQSGRNPDEITLVAVSKYVDATAVEICYQAGQRIFGESRIQECQDKIVKLRPITPEAIWSLIGHLQSNKVARAVNLFDQIQSVDSLKIAQEIDRRCDLENRVMEVYLEMNITGETRKYGFPPEEIVEIAGEIVTLKNLRLKGIMTIGPHTDDKRQISGAFERAYRIYDNLKQALPESPMSKRLELSMGMSGDYSLAIAAGATVVRVGSAIFGQRH